MKEPMWANGNLRLELPRQNTESAVSDSFNISCKSLNTTQYSVLAMWVGGHTRQQNFLLFRTGGESR